VREREMRIVGMVVGRMVGRMRDSKKWGRWEFLSYRDEREEVGVGDNGEEEEGRVGFCVCVL
jgi:hypothetical protein